MTALTLMSLEKGHMRDVQNHAYYPTNNSAVVILKCCQLMRLKIKM